MSLDDKINPNIFLTISEAGNVPDLRLHHFVNGQFRIGRHSDNDYVVRRDNRFVHGYHALLVMTERVIEARNLGTNPFLFRPTENHNWSYLGGSDSVGIYDSGGLRFVDNFSKALLSADLFSNVHLFDNDNGDAWKSIVIDNSEDELLQETGAVLNYVVRRSSLNIQRGSIPLKSKVKVGNLARVNDIIVPFPSVPLEHFSIISNLEGTRIEMIDDNYECYIQKRGEKVIRNLNYCSNDLYDGDSIIIPPQLENGGYVGYIKLKAPHLRRS